MEELANDKTRLTITDQARILFKRILDPIAQFLTKLGITPNTITVLGFLGNVVGACFLATGRITLGGIIILFMAPLDAVDGTMARLRSQNGMKEGSSPFGAFLDSVTDRYSELALFGGLLIYFSWRGEWIGSMLAFLAAAGSIMVSYTRARAQSLNIETKVGLLTRLERYIILVPSLIFNIPLVGLGIVALFANITALQRIFDVHRQLNNQK